MTLANENAAIYETWVRSYMGDVYRSALRLCGDSNSAEELTQQVFLEAWRSMNSLREPHKARPWLLGILRFTYMHWLRERRRRPQPCTDAALDTLASAKPRPGEALARQEGLQAALDALDDRYKTPLLMVYLDGFTCQQTAEQLGIPLGTVLSRTHRAKRFLRTHLPDEAALLSTGT